MKWMIASDIHGSAYYCRKLLEAYTEEGADRLLFGGYFIPRPQNDLPRRLCAQGSDRFIERTEK